jgi:penicillin amidase
MDRDLTRRGLVAALVAAGTGAATLSSANGLLEAAAPLSGNLWATAGEAPESVESEYGAATVTYDDYHVPHVEAESEQAAYFAVGYVQAADRFVEMDLLRRRAGGSLAELVGEPGVETDVFRTKMDFEGAAAAAVDRIADTDAEPVLQAYVDGVNAYLDAGPPGFVYGLLDVDPEPWRPRDTMLVVLEMGWILNGGFRSIRRQVLRESLDQSTYRTLFPDQLDHGTPIVRPGETGGTISGIDDEPAASAVRAEPAATEPLDPAFADYISRFDGPDWAGSNGWTVSGEFTESGEPILCSDPHLSLQAPPVWYQQRVETPATTVRGVAVPGIPIAAIGENDHCAWGLTNVGVQAVDCYTYETDGDRYRYRDEWREFETETRTVPVAGGADREVTVRKTVHGASLDREIAGETHSVGVSWIGFGGVRDLLGIYEAAQADSTETFREGIGKLDVIVQNVHYADRDGDTLYQLSGRLPIRRVDGEAVPSDRVFDGSAGEGEWQGFEPYGQSSWEGFVPFDRQPRVLNPDYLASANQRTADEPEYPLSVAYAPGFRGVRIYEVLDEAVAEGAKIDADAMRDLQLDSHSVPARLLVPELLAARDRLPDAAEPWLDALAEWDYRMVRDSRAALVFARFADHYREVLWREDFEARGLSEQFWPSPWIDATLPADSDVFETDRAAAFAAAMERAVADIDEAGWETYGDYNVTAFDHPLGGRLPGLNYERHPTDGGDSTVRRFNTREDHGASFRQIVDFGGDSISIIPGGNDGSPLSDNYEDQLPLWADGEYRERTGPPDGEPDVRVREADR